MGPSDEDVSYNYITRNRQVSIPGFWMDRTEVSNNQYRLFVNWTRDSLIYKILFGPGINKANDTSAVNWTRMKTVKLDRNTIEKLNELNLAPDNRLYVRKSIPAKSCIGLNIMTCLLLLKEKMPVYTEVISS
jgi:formylglycine-generating enzyme required for sulfatase activity